VLFIIFRAAERGLKEELGNLPLSLRSGVGVFGVSFSKALFRVSVFLIASK